MARRADTGVSSATVGCWLGRVRPEPALLAGHRRHPVPSGRITACTPARCLTSTVKKVGRIPNGGSWCAQPAEQHRAPNRGPAKTAGAPRGYRYRHSGVDGFFRVAYTRFLGNNETATTAVDLLPGACAYLSAHGTTRNFVRERALDYSRSDSSTSCGGCVPNVV